MIETAAVMERELLNFFSHIMLVNLCIQLVSCTSVGLFVGINRLVFNPSGFPNSIIMSFKAGAAFILMTSCYLRSKSDKSWKLIQASNLIKKLSTIWLSQQSHSEGLILVLCCSLSFHKSLSWLEALIRTFIKSPVLKMPVQMSVSCGITRVTKWEMNQITKT